MATRQRMEQSQQLGKYQQQSEQSPHMGAYNNERHPINNQRINQRQRYPIIDNSHGNGKYYWSNWIIPPRTGKPTAPSPVGVHLGTDTAAAGGIDICSTIMPYIDITCHNGDFNMKNDLQ